MKIIRCGTVVALLGPFDKHHFKRMMWDEERSLTLNLLQSTIALGDVAAIYSVVWNATRRGVVITLLISDEQQTLLDYSGVLHLVPAHSHGIPRNYFAPAA